MIDINNSYRVALVEGDATISNEQLGESIAERGMHFSGASNITIRTGPSSRVVLITPMGDAMEIGEMSCEVISKRSGQDFVDTLRKVRVTARDMMAARRMVTLQTAVSR